MDNRILATLHGIDGALAKAGVPPLSPFWQAECERFYTSPTARLLVECVGRGGDKSRTSTMMAIAETLAGDYVIPPGERHYFVHVSENRDEAAKTLAIAARYLELLGVPFARTTDTLELEQLPRGIRVLACRIGAVSGFRCFGWTADECAKWNSEGADPSAEVIASIRAMTVTHRSARGRMISSPVGVVGHFYDVWSAGETDAQVTGHAASWRANPSISESQTHALCTDAKVWSREYAAIPQQDATCIVDASDVALMVRPLASCSRPIGRPACFLDSSSGRGDGFAWMVAQYFDEGGSSRLYVSKIHALEGEFSRSLTFADVVAKVAETARGKVTFGDQYQAFSLASEFARHGIQFVERPWAQSSKIEAASTLRQLLRDHRLVVEPGLETDKLRAELMGLTERLLPSGALSVVARRTGAGHCDRASVLLSIARAVSDGDIRGTRPAQTGPPANRVMAIRSQFGHGAGTAMEPPRNRAQLEPSRGAFSWTPNNRRKSPFQNW